MLQSSRRSWVFSGHRKEGEEVKEASTGTREEHVLTSEKKIEKEQVIPKIMISVILILMTSVIPKLVISVPAFLRGWQEIIAMTNTTLYYLLLWRSCSWSWLQTDFVSKKGKSWPKGMHLLLLDSGVGKDPHKQFELSLLLHIKWSLVMSRRLHWLLEVFLKRNDLKLILIKFANCVLLGSQVMQERETVTNVTMIHGLKFKKEKVSWVGRRWPGIWRKSGQLSLTFIYYSTYRRWHV